MCAKLSFLFMMSKTVWLNLQSVTFHILQLKQWQIVGGNVGFATLRSLAYGGNVIQLSLNWWRQLWRCHCTGAIWAWTKLFCISRQRWVESWIRLGLGSLHICRVQLTLDGSWQWLLGDFSHNFKASLYCYGHAVWIDRREHGCLGIGESSSYIDLDLSYKPLWTSSSLSLSLLLYRSICLSHIRSGSWSMSTTAGPAALCLTWSWGTSIPFECSVKTSVAWAMKLASARTPPSFPKQVMKSLLSTANCNGIALIFGAKEHLMHAEL